MTNVDAELVAEPLLFNWETPQSPKVVLGSFLALSLVAHVFCFYVFQIIYPTPVTVSPLPARVTFIVPNSDEGGTLLRWIDAEDPALVFTTIPPPGEKFRALPAVEHIPTYSAFQPTLKELPPLKPDLRIPSSQPPGAVISLLRKVAPVTINRKTVIGFSEEFDRFGAPNLPSTRFVASNNETPKTVRFRVAVNEFGEIRYCLPIDSSGDTALDEQARLQVVHSRFHPEKSTDGNLDPSLVWGVATIHWGNEIVRPRETSPASARP